MNTNSGRLEEWLLFNAPILANPLSYSLTSTIPSHTQQSQINYNTPNPLNTLSSQHTSNTITPTLQTSHFKYKILLQQQLEPTLTFITLLLLP